MKVILSELLHLMTLWKVPEDPTLVLSLFYNIITTVVDKRRRFGSHQICWDASFSSRLLKHV